MIAAPPPDDDWQQRERLHIAAADGDLAQVGALLAAGADVRAFDDLGCTPLHHAIEQGHFEIALTLLAAGADINAHDAARVGETPLGHVINGCSVEIATFLMEHGADPAIQGWMQLTALDRAARRRDAAGPEVLRVLRRG
jgi:ankyrin repeat protein